ncbi:MAG: 5-methylcytosine-specific restriction enzyme subunit McrC [Marivirga sp.]|jgi:5-methylcytosine-specific restriction enzyme subunit McrC
MNQLWEDYIYRILYKHTDDSFEVLPQQSTDFWESKSIRPDIVIKRGEETYIIDTKWKVVDNNEPSDADLKQMFSYNLLWKAEKSMLLYPKVDQSDSNFGTYHFLPEENNVNQCKLGFVSLTDGDVMIQENLIANEIFNKLEIA